ncbi:MAG: glycoside hydrolase family 2 TIM barrel-domain containing protein, partial [Eubacteriales bacterium]|nr:glycoside hydrolase family 2 TIM barrel-domain containing protein [Eubacteriales bacterium]
TLRFGCRDIAWTDHGMYINGVKTRVNGICCHQDHVGVGIAVTKSLIRMRMKKLKEMGCNAIRCAHNPPSAYQLEVCDEIGLLVMAENRHFRSSEEVLKQLDELVLLSRSHPSVFLYSLFNEEHLQGEIRGRRMAARMTRRIKALDDTRPVTAAMNGGVLMRENASDVLDVAGINYCLGDYGKYAERRPGHPMVATENGPLYATRGIYKDDPKAQVYNSYGLTTSFFGQTLQETVRAVEEAEHLAGLFVWGGFDYRGEPQPFEWPSVYSHWGLTDSCGFEKDTFHMLRSYYTDEPMLHLLPHWNWAEGEEVRVCAMTNCAEVRFSLNGSLLGTVAVEDRRAEMHIPFAPGVLRAEAVCGDVIVADEVRTAGVAAALEITDAADGKDYDSAIVNVRLLDANGIPVPGREADRTVVFRVERGTIIGVGNGDPNGVLPEIAESIPTFCGRCQAIIRPDAEGRVRVRISAQGLAEAVYER